MVKKELWGLMSREVPPLFSSLGFTENEPGAFMRVCAGFVQGFGFSPNRSVTQFFVPVGVTVPALWPKNDFIDQGHYPSLIVSRRLGEFRKKMRGLDEWYPCATDAEFRAALPRVKADFVAQAVPWLERFKTLEDVASDYYFYRIGPPTGGGRRPPDPFAWAMYGWLLQAIGKNEEAKGWLEKAYYEVRMPLFIDRTGRFVSEHTAGARAYKRPEPEERLEELLRQSLRLPIP
jgi:hypothetical protein